MEKLLNKDAEELIASFQKNSVEIVKATLLTWDRNRYVDFRVYRLEEAGSLGSEQPTSRGICINCDLLPELKRLIEKTLARANGVD